MSEYLHTPLPATMLCARQFIGVRVFVELHCRILGGKFGSIPRCLSDDAFSMTGYCIDAPELIPAGGCYYDEFAPPDEDGPCWVVSQFTTNRED